jgi:hypothetical protein
VQSLQEVVDCRDFQGQLYPMQKLLLSLTLKPDPTFTIAILRNHTFQYLSALWLMLNFHLFLYVVLTSSTYHFITFSYVLWYCLRVRISLNLSCHVGILSTGNMQKTSRGQCCLTSLSQAGLFGADSAGCFLYRITILRVGYI